LLARCSVSAPVAALPLRRTSSMPVRCSASSEAGGADGDGVTCHCLSLAVGGLAGAWAAGGYAAVARSCAGASFQQLRFEAGDALVDEAVVGAGGLQQLAEEQIDYERG
jgi:hypothetical protein